MDDDDLVAVVAGGNAPRCGSCRWMGWFGVGRELCCATRAATHTIGRIGGHLQR
jgi:hypothetical protein